YFVILFLSMQKESIQKLFTKLFNCDFTIIGAPMFLVSNESLVSEVSLAGGIGATPSLNWRTSEEFDAALSKISDLAAGKPYGVNLIVNKVNSRVDADLEKCVKHKVPL